MLLNLFFLQLLLLLFGDWLEQILLLRDPGLEHLLPVFARFLSIEGYEALRLLSFQLLIEDELELGRRVSAALAALTISEVHVAEARR